MTFRWGILGTGAISAKFVAGLPQARDARATLIASRSLVKAQAFAQGLGIGRAVEGYAQAIAQGDVDAMYIATPPSEHAVLAQQCIEAGIPILVEKPFTSSEADTRRIADLAESRSVFAMEAMWTRFLPAAIALKQKIADGAIGEVRLISGSFGSSQAPDPRNGMFNAALGGGALAHLGPYPVSLAQWVFGDPLTVTSTGRVGDGGADEDAAFQLRYKNGVTGSFFVSSRAWAPDDLHIMGSRGMISVRGSIVRPYGLTITSEEPIGYEEAQFGWKAKLRQHGLIHKIAQRAGRSSRAGAKVEDHHYSGNGYHYEADEVRACIERGKIQSDVMPLADSISVARTIDTIRSAIHGQAIKEGNPA